jgi:hypothetical protein
MIVLPVQHRITYKPNSEREEEPVIPRAERALTENAGFDLNVQAPLTRLC